MPFFSTPTKKRQVSNRSLSNTEEWNLTSKVVVTWDSSTKWAVTSAGNSADWSSPSIIPAAYAAQFTGPVSEVGEINRFSIMFLSLSMYSFSRSWPFSNSQVCPKSCFHAKLAMKVIIGKILFSRLLRSLSWYVSSTRKPTVVPMWCSQYSKSCDWLAFFWQYVTISENTKARELMDTSVLRLSMDAALLALYYMRDMYTGAMNTCVRMSSSSSSSSHSAQY